VFTIKDNPKLNTKEVITEWMNLKVKQIDKAIEDKKDPNKSPFANKVLESVHKIPGLGDVGDLKKFGFTIQDNGDFSTPAGLTWEDTGKDPNNWNLKLVE